VCLFRHRRNGYILDLQEAWQFYVAPVAVVRVRRLAETLASAIRLRARNSELGQRFIAAEPVPLGVN
jgi:hypothetical protein